MAATHLLDTSVYSQPIKRKPNEATLQRWSRLGDNRVVVSAICQAEVRFGILKSGASTLLTAYETSLKNRLSILKVDEGVAESYAQLCRDCEALGHRVADMDLLIAATAHAHGLIIATPNVSDFQAIPGVTVEDWSN